VAAAKRLIRQRLKITLGERGTCGKLYQPRLSGRNLSHLWIAAESLSRTRRSRRPAGGRRARAALSGEGLEAGGEVAELGRLRDDPEAAQVGGLLGHRGDDLDDVIDVALGVGPARDGEADEVHRGR